MKVLFLDIDGVLNSTRTAVAFNGYPFTLNSLEKFDHVAISLIRRLCTTGVKVVLSSAWRLDHEAASVGQAFDLPIIDRTPHLLGPRGREIAAWLDAATDVECYAIVDDDPDMLAHQLPFFVQTNGHEGLTWANYGRLCSLFGVSPHDGKARDRNWRDGAAVPLAWE